MVEGCAHRQGAVTREQVGITSGAGKIHLSLPVPESTTITTIVMSRLFNKAPLLRAYHIPTVQGISTFKNLGMVKDFHMRITAKDR